MTSESPSEKNVPVSVKKGQSPIHAFQNEMNDLFRSFFGETLPHWWRASEDMMPFGVCPATDVTETARDFKITAELPGMDVKDISVTIRDGYVTIKGAKEAESKEEKSGYYRQERSFGEFQRVVALPLNMADEEKAEAHMGKGVLTITIPKKAEAQSTPRTIDIKHAA